MHAPNPKGPGGGVAGGREDHLGQMLPEPFQNSKDSSWAPEVVCVARRQGQRRGLSLKFQASNWSLAG